MALYPELQALDPLLRLLISIICGPGPGCGARAQGLSIRGFGSCASAFGFPCDVRGSCELCHQTMTVIVSVVLSLFTKTRTI